ncbi:hypothetical protein OV203_08185 [Nannocystis sp. ILAH1]|uniref:hypothetical protein n=1 Tax=unclassified Nannocystis TaxID=2627009 RepID=UPI00226E3FBA|nr:MULTISPECIES: hypothetical protein [unclassified Nannocystis]MCY0987098.1 hypothetical protein [Nannocystis sp. ILAH1]MCY1071981.1 hypothetical protein [Nannocystis sp. RBIL2]
MTAVSPAPGLCARCVSGRRIDSAKGSTFWRCAEHDRDPSWPKYPRLPVLRCSRFVAGEVPAGPAPE